MPTTISSNPSATHMPSLPLGIKKIDRFSRRSDRVELDGCARHVKKWNEIKNRRGIHQDLVRAARGFH